MNIKLIGIAVIVISSPFCLAYQENPGELCKSAATLYADGDLDGALEEAKWCVTQLEQIKQNQTASFFKNEIIGFNGEEINQQNAMGINVVERQYTKGEQGISVTLTGGSGGGAMNAFAALAQFGAASGMSKIRIQRRAASVNVDGDTTTVMISLKSGGLLNFESSTVSKDELIVFAKAFPVEELDMSLQK